MFATITGSTSLRVNGNSIGDTGIALITPSGVQYKNLTVLEVKWYGLLAKGCVCSACVHVQTYVL